MKYFFRIVFFVVIPLLFLSSCKGKKKADNNHDNKQNVTVSSDTGVDLSSPLYLKAKDMYLNQDTFSTVEIKFDLKLQLPDKNVSGSGTLRMANDSLMWLYIKAFGLEIARAKFTKDSVFAVVKLKNQYFKGDYSVLKKFFPVDFDFDILQSVFLNKFFLFPKNSVENLSYFTPEEQSGKLILSSGEKFAQNYSMINKITLSTQKNRVEENVAVTVQSQKGIKIRYADLKDFGGHLLPLQVVFEGQGTDFSVAFDYQKAVFGKALQYPLTIPSTYKPFEF
jgi:hypothetical protein